MRLFSLLLILLLPLSALAGNGSGNVSSVYCFGGSGANPTTQACVPIPSGATMFSVVAGNYAANMTAGQFAPFYKNGSVWQVGSGKTAYCFGLNSQTGGTPPNSFQLVASSASFTFNAASITTTGMPAGYASYEGGATTVYTHTTAGSVWTVSYVPGFTYQFGPLTYPGFQAGQSQGFLLQMECYEN